MTPEVERAREQSRVFLLAARRCNEFQPPSAQIMADTTATCPGSEPYVDRDLAMVADVSEVWHYIHESILSIPISDSCSASPAQLIKRSRP